MTQVSKTKTGRGRQSQATYRRVCLGWLTIGLIFTAPLVATAQSTEEESSSAESGVLEEVIVTARYRSENLQLTPLAISAFTGKDLEAKGVLNLTDMSSVAPNVTLINQGTNSGKALGAWIRGIGQGDFNFALEPGVGIYMDDVYYGTIFGSAIELADVERVEVLRGPQGTLFGRNSVGGAVRVYSVKPKGDNSGYAELTYGNYNLVQARAAIDLGLSDNLALRFSGGARSRDGFVDMIDFVCRNPDNAGETLPRTTNAPGCVTGTMGGEDARYFRAAARYTPTENLEINLAYSKNIDDGEAVAETLLIVDRSIFLPVLDPLLGFPYDQRFLQNKGFYETYNALTDLGAGLKMPNYSGIDEDNLSLDIRWDTAIGMLRSVTASRTFDGGFTLAQGGAPTLSIGIHNPIESDQFTQELTLSNSTDFGNRNVDWTVGAFYYDNESTSLGYVTIPSLYIGVPWGPLRFTQDNTADSKSWSVFAHADIDLTDRWGLELGLRYTDDEKAFIMNQYFIDDSGRDTGIPFVVTKAAPVTETRTDYRVNLTYQATDEVMVYGSVSTGYKPGGSNPRPSSDPRSQIPFGPEEVINYELGSKMDLFDNTTRLNLAVFQMDYTDLQTRYTSFTGFDQYGNFGEVRIRGFEGELTAYLTEAFSINASLGLLDWKVVDLGKIADDPASGLTADARPSGVPETTASIGAQYEFGLAGGARLTPRVDLTYQSDNVTFANAIDDTYIPSRTLVNANLTYDSADSLWAVTLSARNLLDEEYYLSKISSRIPFGTVDGQPGWPRELFLTVRRNFD